MTYITMQAVHSRPHRRRHGRWHGLGGWVGSLWGRSTRLPNNWARSGFLASAEAVSAETGNTRPNSPYQHSVKLLTAAKQIALAAALMLAAAATSQAASAGEITAFVNVRLLTFEEGEPHTYDGSLLVDGRTILALGTAEDIDVPAGARVIDGGGATLMPGLTEMHGHLPMQGWSEIETDNTLFLYLARGVTTVRGMLGDPIQFDLRRDITAGKRAGPTLYLAAPSLSGTSVSTPDDVKRLIAKHAEEGWDLQKIHPGLTRDEFIKVVEHARKEALPFAGHIPADVGILVALRSGINSIEHMDGYMAWLEGDKGPISDDALLRAAAFTKEAGIWIVPTQSLFNLLRSGGDLDALLARPENKYVSPRTLKAWEARVRQLNVTANRFIANNRQRLLRAMGEAGVNLAVGSDAPQIFSVPGFSMLREMQTMRDAGLSNDTILAAATQAAGKYFDLNTARGSDDTPFGELKPGYRADLILVSGDPRADLNALAELRGVMAAGHWYTKAEIDTRLEEIAASYSTHAAAEE